jgi:predicted nucleic acid-binding protein
LKVLIDTNILIEIIKSNVALITKFQELLGEHTFCINPTILAELLQGAREKERAVIAKIVGSAVCLDITCETGRIAGELANKYSKSHSSITLDDFIIAASAKQHNCKFWTLNKKHFPMFQKTELV